MKLVMKPVVIIAIAMGLALGCAPVPREVRIYDLETGAIITAQIKDARQTHGEISMIHPSTGETFTGEYTSIPRDKINKSFFSTHWGMVYGFSFNEPRAIYGQATCIGNRGTTIEIVYAVDRKTLHGHGVGRDNSGNEYKVHF